MRRLLACLFVIVPCFSLSRPGHGQERCAAPHNTQTDGEMAEARFIEDIFALTDGRIIGWRQDVAIGLYGFDTLETDDRFQQAVRAFREVTGLNIGWAALGGRTNVALIYASYRTLTLDPGLTGLVDSLGGQDADLFSDTGALARDDDGYHYHFRLGSGGQDISVAVVFIDRQRFTPQQAQALLPKAVSDTLVVGGGSEALVPSFRQSPTAALAHLAACDQIPEADLNLYDLIYEPRFLTQALALDGPLSGDILNMVIDP